MSAPTIKRKKAWVDPEVQGGILRKVAIHWVLFFICNTIALVIWIRLFEQPDVAWGQTFADTLRRFLPFFVITAALIPAFVLDTLKLTNRFAGPVMRLRSALADAKNGKPVPKLQFRDSDFWKQLADDFNSVMNRVETDKSDEQENA